jgi:hypothetical protein
MHNIGYQQYVWMEDEEEMVRFRGVHGSVRFGSVFIKKSNQTEFFFLKKPKPVQTDWFRLGFFRAKTGSNRFGLVFSVWLGFFPFGSSGSKLKKPKPNRTGRFFQNFNRFNRFFLMVRFFWLFFSVFSV